MRCTTLLEIIVEADVDPWDHHRLSSDVNKSRLDKLYQNLARKQEIKKELNHD